MPLTQDLANINLDLYDLTIGTGGGAETFPHHLGMRVVVGLIESPITSAAVGQTPLGYMVVGHIIEITIEPQQLRSELEEFLDLTAGVPPAVGELRTEHTVTLHPVDAADTSTDIIIPKAVFGPTVDSNKDASKPERGTIMIRAVHNGSDPVWRLGPAA